MTRSVSAIVPTTGRRASLGAAVESCLGQSVPPAEVIVVVDAAEDVRTALADQWSAERRVRIVPNQASGPSAARMTGVRAAATELVAFLDDDDSWLPTKLERQLAALAAVPDPLRAIVATRCLIRSDHTDYVLPRRLPYPGETFASYLLARPAVVLPRSYVATPSLLASRALFLERPLDLGLAHREDIAWLLDATSHGAAFVYVDEVLTVVDGRTARGALSAEAESTDAAVAWGRKYVTPIDPRLERNYRLAYAARVARRSSGRIDAARVGIAALREGRAAPSAVLSWLYTLLAPRQMPRAIRRVLHGLRSIRSTG
jgi:glycosyltransferase involved in cell wall biosynthesis